MRAASTLSLGIDQVQQWMEQLKKSTATSSSTVAPQQPTNTPPHQQTRNADGFAPGNDLKSRYAAALQGASSPALPQDKAPQLKLKSYHQDSFQAFQKPPVALKSPDLAKQPAFFRV